MSRQRLPTWWVFFSGRAKQHRKHGGNTSTCLLTLSSVCCTGLSKVESECRELQFREFIGIMMYWRYVTFSYIFLWIRPTDRYQVVSHISAQTTLIVFLQTASLHKAQTSVSSRQAHLETVEEKRLFCVELGIITRRSMLQISKSYDRSLMIQFEVKVCGCMIGLHVFHVLKYLSHESRLHTSKTVAYP